MAIAAVAAASEADAEDIEAPIVDFAASIELDDEGVGLGVDQLHSIVAAIAAVAAHHITLYTTLHSHHPHTISTSFTLASSRTATAQHCGGYCCSRSG